MNKKHDKKPDIQALFNSIAGKYDFLNDIISLGRHKSIKRSVIKSIPLEKGMNVLDICTGTGDIALGISELFNRQIDITALDFSEKMLEIAKKRAKEHANIKFVQADMRKLPFDDATFDAVFISFGLRHVKELEPLVLEIKRVIKPGGWFANLDVGKPKGLYNLFFRLYFFNLVPLFGKIFGAGYLSYKYLPESAENFPSQEGLMEVFNRAGFVMVNNRDFLFGALAAQTAQKTD
ncbi:MAG: ubiquinone/menaquinone biosynthesis methyltransferase [Candidatus Gastranaerophilales bacterium]|nr:ubiquinone/menaquinone biosynthesis methyltransferase [Candidatus Gastranaerophilales bacterium]